MDIELITPRLLSMETLTIFAAKVNACGFETSLRPDPTHIDQLEICLFDGENSSKKTLKKLLKKLKIKKSIDSESNYFTTNRKKIDIILEKTLFLAADEIAFHTSKLKINQPFPITLSTKSLFGKSKTINSDKLNRIIEAIEKAQMSYTNIKEENKICLYHSICEIEAFSEAYQLRGVFAPMCLQKGILYSTITQADLTLDSNTPLQYKENEDTLLHHCTVLNELLPARRIRILNEDKNLQNIELIQKMLLSHDGVCIGESHDDNGAKRLLIDNFKLLHHSGVQTIYLEHLNYDSMQQIVESYNKSSDPMPPLLEYFLKGRTPPFSLFEGSGFIELLEAARKASIRVVGIDTTITYECGSNKNFGIIDAGKRLMAMNHVAYAIIAKEQMNSQGKYVALMGADHLGTTLLTPKIKGVAELLSVPSIIVRTRHKRYSKGEVSPVRFVSADLWVDAEAGRK